MTVSKLGDSLVNIIGSDIACVIKDGDDLGVIKISDNKPKGIGDTGKNTIHEVIKHINEKINSPIESKLSYKSEGKDETKNKLN